MEKLNRVFDQVALSREREDALLADLLNEKREVSNMKQTNRRRIPAAALVAAALVVVLAGTALAEGYFGRLDVRPVDGDFENGYWVTGAYQNISPERLSEELLERAAQVGRGYEDLVLGSWSEAEDFIGLEIANNAVLDEMARLDYEQAVEEGEPPHECDTALEDLGRCTVHVSYSLGVPNLINLFTQYWGGDFAECPAGLQVFAFVRVKAEGHEDMPFELGDHNSQSAVGEYVTPDGMRAIIFSGGYDVNTRDGTYLQPTYSVYFTMNDALFWMRAEFNAENADTVLNGLKRVLDAFE